MSKKFPEYSNLNLSGINEEMLKRDEKGVFRKSLEMREGVPRLFL